MNYKIVNVDLIVISSGIVYMLQVFAEAKVDAICVTLPLNFFMYAYGAKAIPLPKWIQLAKV